MTATRRLLVPGTLVALILGLAYLVSDTSAGASSATHTPAPRGVTNALQELVVPGSGEISPSFAPPMSQLTPFTVTVSGTVTGPSGPVPDVRINANAGATGLPYSQDAITDGSGFYSFTNLSPGTKSFNLEIFRGTRPPTYEQFTFFLRVPGFVPDYAQVRFAELYANEELQQIPLTSVPAVIDSLPCCTTSSDG